MRHDVLKLPATRESLRAIADFALEAADAAGLDEHARYNLRLAVDELATNIVHYAYTGLPVKPDAAPFIEIQAAQTDDAVTIRLEDAGVPFDPRRIPAPADLNLPPEQRKIGGLGVFLALRSVDEYSYERAGDRNRSTLVMHRAQSKPESDAPDERDDRRDRSAPDHGRFR